MLSIKMVGVLAAAAATSIAPGTMPARFNLSCEGVEQGVEIDGIYTASPDKPKGRVLRVDLTRQRWCEGLCKAFGELELREGSVFLVHGPSAILPTVTAFSWPAKTATTYRKHPARIGEVWGLTRYRCRPQPFNGRIGEK